MAKQSEFKKRLANLSLGEAQAMDKAYSDAAAAGLSEYTYKGLKYAVKKEPRILATDLVNTKPVTKTQDSYTPRNDEDYETYTKRINSELRSKAKIELEKGNIKEANRLVDIGKDAVKGEEITTTLNRIDYPYVAAPTPEPKKKLVTPEILSSPSDSLKKVIATHNQPVYKSVENESKDFYANMDKVKAKAQLDLQQRYPNSKVEVRSHDKKRDVVTQQKYLNSGASRTALSMHNLGLGEDVGIYIDGKLTDDTDAYRVLGAAAKEHGNFWGWDWDKGHISKTDNVANAMRKNPNIAKEPVVQNFSNQYSKGTVPEKYRTTLHVVDSLAGKPDRQVKYIGGKGNEVLPDNLLEPLYPNTMATNKKKLATGGLTPEKQAQYENYSQYGQMGAQAINMIDGMDGKPSYAGGVASGALSGASMGMALGPYGAAAGAVIGGGAAIFAAEANKNAEEKANHLYMKNLEDEAKMGSKQTLNNYAMHGIGTQGNYAYGGEIEKDIHGNSITANIKNEPKANRSYYDDRINTMVLGSDYNTMPKSTQDRVKAHENYHAKQYAMGTSNFDIAHNTDKAILNRLKNKPPLTASDEEYYDYHNRKAIEVEADINNFRKRNKDFNFVSDDVIFDKNVDYNQYDNPNSFEGEATNYENTGKIKKPEYAYGGAIKPYVAKDSKDYKFRKQAYDDSLSMHNLSVKRIEQIMQQPINKAFKDGGFDVRPIPKDKNYEGIQPTHKSDSSLGLEYWSKPEQKVLPPESKKTVSYLTPKVSTLESTSTEPIISEKIEGIKPKSYKKVFKPSSQAGYGQFREYGKYVNQPQYAYGGTPNPEYEVEEGEVVQGQPQLEEGQQVASDMHLVGGEKHEQGGTDGIGGDRVFSDRLKPVRGGKTYAGIAEKLGKDKGKFESKIDSRDEATSNTGKRMTERIDKKLDDLFNEQEMKKQYANMPSFSSSSKQKFDGGGTPLKLKPVLNIDGKPLYYDDINHKGTYGTYQDALANGTQYRAGQPGNKYPYPTILGQDGRWYANNDSVTPIQPKATSLMVNDYKPTSTLPAYTSPPNTYDLDGGKGKKISTNGIPWQYVDNLANGIATANTPQIAKPYLDPALKMNTNFDINPQLSSARNTKDAVLKSINANTAQTGTSNSNKQQLYASYNENANNLYAQKNNVENELKNKEILVNSNINSRNNDKRYAYDVENTKRRAGIAEDYAANASNFALDQYTSNRDNKMDARDIEVTKMIMMANPNSATYSADLQSVKNMYANNPAGLRKTIDAIRLQSPNNPALKTLEAQYAELTRQ